MSCLWANKSVDCLHQDRARSEISSSALDPTSSLRIQLADESKESGPLVRLQSDKQNSLDPLRGD